MPVRLLFVATLLITLATPAAATLPFTPVLLPVYTRPTPGAHGSLWVSELMIHNPQPYPVDLVVCTQECSTIQVSPGSHPDLLADYASVPGEVPAILVGTYNHTPSLSLRVRDVSRSDKSLGLELPAASVNNAFPAVQLLLLDIPIQSQFRYKLRLYDLAGEAAALLVRVVVVDTAEVLSETSVTLAVSTRSKSLAYAELDPLPASTIAAREGQRLRLEVKRKDGRNVNWEWAFLSITNNETQELTAVTPQFTPP